MGKSSMKRMTERCNTPTQDLIDKTGLKPSLDFKKCGVCKMNVWVLNFKNAEATTCNRCKNNMEWKKNMKKLTRKKRVKQ